MAMGVFPDLITCDFSPVLLGAIKHVYGKDVIQIDLFHVMQLLNNGIKADLQKYREKRFDAERRELRALRTWACSVQKHVKEGHEFPMVLRLVGKLPDINAEHTSSSRCERFALKMLELLKGASPNLFFPKLQYVLRSPAGVDSPEEEFFNNISKHVPKRSFTEKGMLRVKGELLKKLKTFFLRFRRPIDDESTQFNRISGVIFFQPENLTPKREERLASLLDDHPDLSLYREMTLLVGEISRLPPEEIDGHQIGDLGESPIYSKKLNAAIRTIKRHKANILRFVNYFKANPGLSKAQRSNMEFYNRKFKEPFEAGNNLLKKERVLGRLNTQLSGKVEWFLGNKVLA